MATVVKMPKLGLTMTEGVVLKWHKQEGEYIEKGENLLDIESDKSVGYYESPVAGYVIKLLANEGDTVLCQKEIAVIGEKGETYNEAETGRDSNDTADEKNQEEKIANEKAAKEPENEIAEGETARGADKRVFASPAAKRIAKENGIDVSVIPMKPGKVRLESADVLEYITANKVKTTPLAAKIAEENNIDVASLGITGGKRVYSSDLDRAEVVPDRTFPVQGIRKTVAKRLKESLDTAAHATLSMKVDMSEAVLFREKTMPKILEKHGVKISLNDVITKCVAQALTENRRMNCVFTGTEIIEKGQVNIGMAVALDEGLIAPVVKNVDKLCLWELAAENHKLVKKAKTTGLSEDEISGGTFSISNMGMMGVIRCTSIINQPESAILSVGMVEKEAVVVDDKIVIKPMMDLTINYDHRPIDGSTAAIFLNRVRDLLQDPWGIII